jgi:nucleoside-specific outer membrane channel protein Tsx
MNAPQRDREYSVNQLFFLTFPLVGPEEAKQVLEYYNKYTGHSTLWDKFRTLQTIYSTQQFLKHIDVLSIQTYMDAEMWGTTWHAPDYIKTLQDLTREPLQTFEGSTFLDWSYKNGFKVTDPGLHPLEDAHSAACELWLDKYAQAINA